MDKRCGAGADQARADDRHDLSPFAPVPVGRSGLAGWIGFCSESKMAVRCRNSQLGRRG